MFTALLAATRAAFATWKQERAIARDIAELNRMDDLHLADLGIGRCQIAAYVRSRLPKPPSRPRLTLVPDTGTALADAPPGRRRRA